VTQRKFDLPDPETVRTRIEQAAPGEVVQVLSEPTVVQNAHPILALITTATDRGMGADELGKYLELYEKYEANEARKAFAAAMVRCQREMPAIVKDAANAHTKSTYARLETITALIQPVYTRHGFSLSFGTADSPLAGHLRIVCDVQHERGHCNSHQLDIQLDGTGPKGEAIGGMNRPQATGSTVSYGRRYLEAMIFNLVMAGEDNDAVGSLSLISEEQAADLRQLLRDIERTEAAFLEWARVESIEAVTLRQYIQAKRQFGPMRRAGGPPPQPKGK
jgi:hypothetical protein